MPEISFGYSPCPNDTYMFWAWAHQRLETPLVLKPQLFDIQELNQLALKKGELDFTKVSMATYLNPAVRAKYQLLSSGAALGRGCGPLLVSKNVWSAEKPTPLRVAIPGRDTTAFKLCQMALGEWISEAIELRYDEIMKAVLNGDVDAGVIIHESRFVYQGLGLQCAFDLGEWWETETGLPLPLGLMLGRRDLPADIIRQAEADLRDSISLADQSIEGDDKKNKASLWEYLRKNAIELEDQTMRSHIELYVNEHSLDLGQEGLAAIEAFQQKASDF